ncbi:chitin-binding protein [Embleya scabrispora]|uniref:Chitin-binding protein n=1 Tax=Embleya scabrispora TaxID=159449 RepID=A0A1T3NRW8_9ACTN|nr:SDR family oxidoreductase [Embleya scabrispora]OPC79663.1 chitin-binding protein [Embleya scabrispora]
MTSGPAGPVVVVTGGTRGIGLGLARAFLDRGCRVALCGRGTASTADAARALSAPPERLLAVTADVADRTRIQGLWDRTADTFGTVDVWINNAGTTTHRRPLWDLPAAEIDTVVTVNLLGVAHGSAVALAGFAEQRSGRLWNMEGFGSDGRRMPGLSGYGASKRAVTYLTDALAEEVAAADLGDVRVAHLSPGMVVTDLLTHGYTDRELARSRKVLSLLADRVETVAPWLADRVLADVPNGGRVAWLTRRKALGRFALAPIRRRDPFTAPAAGVDAGTGGRP